MAKLTLVKPITTKTKMAGILLYNAFGGVRGRSVPIPIIPLTSGQSAAQGWFAQCVAYFYTLPTSVQNSWSLYPYATGTGLNKFVAYNMNLLTWGLPIFPEPPDHYLQSPGTYFFPIIDTSSGQARLGIFTTPSLTAGVTVWVRLYLAVSGLIPGVVAKSSGYIYFGSFGPFATSGNYLFDVNAAINAVYGQVPTATADNLPPFSSFDTIAYVTDQNGTILFNSEGPNSPTTQGQGFVFDYSLFPPPYQPGATFTASIYLGQ